MFTGQSGETIFGAEAWNRESIEDLFFRLVNATEPKSTHSYLTFRRTQLMSPILLESQNYSKKVTEWGTYYLKVTCTLNQLENPESPLKAMQDNEKRSIVLISTVACERVVWFNELVYYRFDDLTKVFTTGTHPGPPSCATAGVSVAPLMLFEHHASQLKGPRHRGFPILRVVPTNITLPNNRPRIDKGVLWHALKEYYSGVPNPLTLASMAGLEFSMAMSKFEKLTNLSTQRCINAVTTVLNHPSPSATPTPAIDPNLSTLEVAQDYVFAAAYSACIAAEQTTILGIIDQASSGVFHGYQYASIQPHLFPLYVSTAILFAATPSRYGLSQGTPLDAWLGNKFMEIFVPLTDACDQREQRSPDSVTVLEHCLLEATQARRGFPTSAVTLQRQGLAVLLELFAPPHTSAHDAKCARALDEWLGKDERASAAYAADSCAAKLVVEQMPESVKGSTKAVPAAAMRSCPRERLQQDLVRIVVDTDRWLATGCFQGNAVNAANNKAQDTMLGAMNLCCSAFTCATEALSTLLVDGCPKWTLSRMAHTCPFLTSSHVLCCDCKQVPIGIKQLPIHGEMRRCAECWLPFCDPCAKARLAEYHRHCGCQAPRSLDDLLQNRTFFHCFSCEKKILKQQQSASKQ